MTLRWQKSKRTSKTLGRVAAAALTAALLGAIFRFDFIFGPALNPLRTRSIGSLTDRQPLDDAWQEDGVVPFLQFKGKDIVIVAGSDGNHSLDTHRAEIKANREDYAAFHGTNH
jgi:hypothetical protein